MSYLLSRSELGSKTEIQSAAWEQTFFETSSTPLILGEKKMYVYGKIRFYMPFMDIMYGRRYRLGQGDTKSSRKRKKYERIKNVFE